MLKLTVYKRRSKGGSIFITITSIDLKVAPTMYNDMKFWICCYFTLVNYIVTKNVAFNRDKDEKDLKLEIFATAVAKLIIEQ